MKRDGDDLIRDIMASGGGSKRSYLSRQHLWSAELFLKRAQELEGSGTQPDPPMKPNRDHRAFVIGAILSSVSYLEASINEIFKDALEGGDGQSGLDSDSVGRLALIWKTTDGGRNLSVLEKYETALLAAQKDPISKETSVYDNAKCLIRLRNALVHFSPEWHYFGEVGPQAQRDRHRLEKALSPKFSSNDLANGCLPYFPDRCLGCGCAKWSVNSSREFYERFNTAMGLPREKASEILEWP